MSDTLRLAGRRRDVLYGVSKVQGRARGGSDDLLHEARGGSEILCGARGWSNVFHKARGGSKVVHGARGGSNIFFKARGKLKLIFNHLKIPLQCQRGRRDIFSGTRRWSDILS